MPSGWTPEESDRLRRIHTPDDDDDLAAVIRDIETIDAAFDKYEAEDDDGKE